MGVSAPRPTAPWPPGFSRIPDEEWTREPVEGLAIKYDRVENHGWYANLDPTVEEVAAHLREGHRMVDYSGGTGILIERLLNARPGTPFGVVNVDSSPKFLRLSLEKLRSEERVAFRLIRFLREEKRLQHLDEVLPPKELGAPLDVITSTNAIHLYYDLAGTLGSWARCIKPGGRVFVQSGNIDRPGRGTRWIIDATVEAVQAAARDIVRNDPKYAPYRAVLNDPKRLAKHDELRHKYFVPVRPLQHYLDALDAAGFRVLRVRHLPIEARVEEWHQFLAVYHDGVLGWLGGTERIEGQPPTEKAIADRTALLREALDRILGGASRFEAEWTYLTCERREL